jgi:hypothetical protein
LILQLTSGLFFLLDFLNNVIQYQPAGNARMILSVIRNKQLFFRLEELRQAGMQQTALREAALHQIAMQLHAQGVTSTGERINTQDPVKRSQDPNKTQDATGEMPTTDANPNNNGIATNNNTHVPVTPTAPNMAGTPNMTTAPAGVVASGTLSTSVGHSGQGTPKHQLPPDVIAAGKDAVDRVTFVPKWCERIPLETLMALIEKIGPVVETFCADGTLEGHVEVERFLSEKFLVGDEKAGGGSGAIINSNNGGVNGKSDNGSVKTFAAKASSASSIITTKSTRYYTETTDGNKNSKAANGTANGRLKLLSLLPPPQPIVVRCYLRNPFTELWFSSYLWGVFFSRSPLPVYDWGKVRFVGLQAPGQEGG